MILYILLLLNFLSSLLDETVKQIGEGPKVSRKKLFSQFQTFDFLSVENGSKDSKEEPDR